MLSVGVFTYSTKPRGSVVHAVNLAEALVHAGHDATLYALAKPGATLYRPLACPVTLIPAGAAPTNADALIRQRIDEFTSGFRELKMRHDIFHAQDCLAANALLEARTAGIGPVVRTVHHVEHFPSAYLIECQRKSICDADAVLSVSELTQKNVLAGFGRHSLLVHNGVDCSRFVARHQETQRWGSERWGVEPGDITVLSVGGVEPRKNTRVALSAVARAHANHPGLRYIIAGGHSIWDHSEYIARFEADLARGSPELRKRVVVAGTLSEEEMTSLYQLSDILLFPSEQEGFGLCVLEAMAAGAAVVVPGRSPFTEYLDESCATFVDSGSARDIAEALITLTFDARRRATLAAAARARAADFSWSRSAAGHLKHYEEIRASRGTSHAHALERWTHA
jgi:glycosyltransferase-like protein